MKTTLTDLFNELSRINRALVNRSITRIQKVTLSTDNLTEEETLEVVKWLNENRGVYSNDIGAYKHMPDTFHAWISNDIVGLHCGFKYQGVMPTKMEIALNAFTGEIQN